MKRWAVCFFLAALTGQMYPQDLTVPGVFTVQSGGLAPGQFRQFVVGNLQGTYSYFPRAWWLGQQAPITALYEDNSLNGYAFMTAFAFWNTTARRTPYGRTLADWRTFVSDANPYNGGSGTLALWTVDEVDNSNGNGPFNAVFSLGDPSHTGFTNSSGQIAEFDAINYGVDQATPGGPGNVKGLSAVCGGGDPGSKNCTLGLEFYGSSEFFGNSTAWRRAIQIDSSIDASIIVPNGLQGAINAFQSVGNSASPLIYLDSNNHVNLGGTGNSNLGPATSGSVVFNEGIYHDGTGFKSAVFTMPWATWCPTAPYTGAVCVSTYKWQTPFPDNNYVATCTIDASVPVTGIPVISNMERFSYGLNVAYVAMTAAPANVGAINCIAIHQ